MTIFSNIDMSKLGESPIEQAIKGYKHTIAGFYIGTLNNGNNYALIIGTSDEWVNVIAYNKAAQPVFQDYGFSIKEPRWSYGSNVLGAPQIREVIAENMGEIKAIMATQIEAREVKAAARDRYYAELEKEVLDEEVRQREEQALLDKINAIREPVIREHFTGLEFQLSSNKKNNNAAQKDASTSYYNIDLQRMTCSCQCFQKRTSQYLINDIRRLCYHLNQIVIDRVLLMRDKDTLKDFVLENVKGSLSGVYIGELKEHKSYCILVYTWTRNIFVATPKVNKIGFMMVRWNLQDKMWTANAGSNVYNKIIRTKLDELFGDECNILYAVENNQGASVC